uniref:Uncharacterized protein n=1 Tax=Amphimedon queenslandica TaxID=400682 RepID=A0A1X7UR49_AMPQE
MARRMANETVETSVETLPLVPSKDLESSMKDLATLGNKEYEHPVSEYQYLREVWEEHKVSNEKEKKIAIEKSGAIWSLIISTYLFPLFGAMILFYACNYWLMTRLPVDITFCLMSQFQTKGMETYKNQEETAAMIKEVSDYLGKMFQNDYANLPKYNQ